MKTSVLSINFSQITRKFLGRGLPLIIMVLLAANSFADNYRRVYVSSGTATSGSITNVPGAVGTDLTDFATLPFPTAFSSRSLNLVFPTSTLDKPVSTDAVHVKVAFNKAVLGVGSELTLQLLDNANLVGNAVNVGDLASVLGGQAIYDIVIPAPGVTFTGVRVTVSTALDLGGSAAVYAAYINKTSSDAIACNTPIDQISGSTAGLVGGLSTVETPESAIDGNILSAAVLRSLASAVNKTYLTALLPASQPIGTLVRVVVQPDDGILNAEVLAEKFAVRTFLGNSNEANITTQGSTLLGVTLLGGQGSKYEILIPATASFDRIEVSLGQGLVSALGELSVFEIGTALATPTIAASSVSIYSGNTAMLSATSGGDGVLWEHTSPVYSSTDNPYTTPALTSSTSYTVKSTLTGCTNVSALATANVTVLPLPTFTDPTSLVEGEAAVDKFISISGGQSGSSYTFTNPSALPAGLTLNSDGSITGTPESGTGTGLAVSFTADVYDVTLGKSVVTGQTFSITIYTALTFTGGAFPATDIYQESYEADLTVLFGPAAGGLGTGYTYSISPILPGGRVSAAGLPTDFTLDAAGVLTGEPDGATADDYTFEVFASDGVQQTSATFTLFISSTPLPVTLTSFKASKEGTTALVSWATTAETNSERFDLERSSNGKIWEIIGTQASKGESSALINYSLTDAAPLAGQNLYRLKMIDLDGTFAHSKIESLNFNSSVASVYPNPVTGAQNIQVSVEDWSKVRSVRVVNQNGKVVFESTNALSAGINTGNLSSGLYVVQVLKTNGTVSSYKVVKQ